MPDYTDLNLKQCPFCGSMELILNSFGFSCEFCGAYGPSTSVFFKKEYQGATINYTREEHATAWNKKA